MEDQKINEMLDNFRKIKEAGVVYSNNPADQAKAHTEAEIARQRIKENPWAVIEAAGLSPAEFVELVSKTNEEPPSETETIKKELEELKKQQLEQQHEEIRQQWAQDMHQHWEESWQQYPVLVELAQNGRNVAKDIWAVHQEAALAIQGPTAGGLNIGPEQAGGQGRLKEHRALGGGDLAAVQAGQRPLGRVAPHGLRAGQFTGIAHGAVPSVALHLFAQPGDGGDGNAVPR